MHELHRQSEPYLEGQAIPPLGWVLLGALALTLQYVIPKLIYFGFSIVNWNKVTLLYSYAISLGLLVWAGVDWFDRRFDGTRLDALAWRIVGGSVFVLASSYVLFAFHYKLLLPFIEGPSTYPMTAQLVTGTKAALLAYFALVLQRAAQSQRARNLQVQLRLDAIATSHAQAELVMLEAQIEPHFLFNTLAHVKRHYQHDAAEAEHMLAALIDYLDRALPSLRCASWTVGHELDLIRVYLGILERRFGPRLRFDITACEPCLARALPALTLSTLVENAVRHGLSPKPEGGTVSICARLDSGGDAMLITVQDDGVGLLAASGSGLGLGMVRARLHGMFGEAASVCVKPQDGGGVLASISISGGT